MRAWELLTERKIIQEGGNAFPDVGTIHIDEIEPTMAYIAELLGMPEAATQALGSVGKADYSGDIDIALNLDREQTAELSSALRDKMGNQNVIGVAGNVTLRVPIQNYDEGKQERQPRTGYVQVDLIPGDPKWLSTFYHSAGRESKYKGVVRNFAITSVANNMETKASKELDEYGRPVKELRWAWGPKGGLQKVLKTSRKKKVAKKKVAKKKVAKKAASKKKAPGRWVWKQDTEAVSEPIFDADEIAKILFKGQFGSEALNSAETVMAAAKQVYPPKMYKKMAAALADVAGRMGVEHPVDESINESRRLMEATVHLEHMEDLLFNNGYDGARDALAFATDIRNTLAKGKGRKTDVTVKWDGSPAIFAGVDPIDGKFFVGTKAALSKSPKLIKSAADAKRYYGDVPDLAAKLLASLKHMKGMGIENMIQGDLMFTKDMLKGETIDGEKYVTFTPNTITYAAPIRSDLGRKISKCDFGIIFHTSYGPAATVREMPMAYGVDISSLKIPSNVWAEDATYKDYTGRASLTPIEDSAIQQQIQSASGTLADIGKSSLNKIMTDPLFKNHISAFVNQRIRSGQHVGDVKVFTDDFLQFFTAKMESGIEKLGPAFQQKRRDKIEAAIKFIEQNQSLIYNVFSLYDNLNELKLAFVNKLNAIDNIMSFTKTEDGYEVTTPEGFVAVGHDGRAVKLVNRLDFTQKNFNRIR